MAEGFFDHITYLRTETIQTGITLFSQVPKVLHCFLGKPSEALVDALCCLGLHSPQRLFRHCALDGINEFRLSEHVKERLVSAEVSLLDISGEMPDMDAVQQRISRNLSLFAPYLPSIEASRCALCATASTLATRAPDVAFGWCSLEDGRAEDFVWSAILAGVPSIAVFFQAGASKSASTTPWGGRAALWAFWVRHCHISLSADTYETAVGIAEDLSIPLRAVNVLLLKPGTDTTRAAVALKRHLGLGEDGQTVVAVSSHALNCATPKLIEAFRQVCAEGPVQCFFLGGRARDASLQQLTAEAGQDNVSIIHVDLPVDAALAVADVCLMSSQECLNGNLVMKAHLSNCTPVLVPSMAEAADPDATASGRPGPAMQQLMNCLKPPANAALPPYASAVLREVRRDWFTDASIRMLYGMHERMVLQLPSDSHDMFSQIKYALKAARLRDLLFGGFVYPAESGLQLLAGDASEPRHERMSACWHLIVWRHWQEEYHKACALIPICRQLSVYPPQLLLQAQACCLLLTKQYEKAVDMLERFLTGHAGAVPGLRILHATTVRLKLLQDGAGAAMADKEYLRLLGEAYRAMNLAPVELREADKPLALDNIRAPSAPAEADCPNTVSVIFPVRNMEHSIAYAVRSVQEQTWTNTEIIVVDDASTDRTPCVVKTLAERDGRIKLTRLAVNQGTYTAVNIGLRAATGDFIAIHGGDDWSHPEKLARQLARFAAIPTAIAVMSRYYRVDMAVNASIPWRLNSFLLMLDPSPLFRRDALLSLGGWDDVRFGADTEITQRARAKFGDSAIITMEEDSIFLLALEGSLTTGQQTGLRSLLPILGARRMYANAYEMWHREAKNNNLSLNIADKTFDAPLANSRERENTTSFDVVILDDFATDKAHTGKGFTLAVRLRAKGLSVALLHWRSPFVDPVRSISPDVHRQSSTRAIRILCSADRIETDSLLVINNGLALSMPDALPDISIVCTTSL